MTGTYDNDITCVKRGIHVGVSSVFVTETERLLFILCIDVGVRRTAELWPGISHSPLTGVSASEPRPNITITIITTYI